MITEHFVIDVFKDADEDAVISILSNNEVKNNYICYDLDYDGLRKKFKQLKLDSKIKIHYARAVFKDGKVIAIVNDVHMEKDKIEIEIAVLPEFQKSDIIAEILNAVTDELMNKKGFSEVLTYCFSSYKELREALEKANYSKLDKEETFMYRGNDVKCLFYFNKR